MPLSRPFFPINPAIPPIFAWKSRSRQLFKDVSALSINLLNYDLIIYPETFSK